ncbi:PREDICTED: U-box domain-containing protein 7-like isoform X1 [Camelina sativa]|uniref:RING-type E3 ubiquitin transferase n=2 Tax=Camelina sativa TaxID=90675 RepID=A0ABM0SS19_CAMSA|nr:PREDICTED: U-box domain-containing protein 7-like isoform X1 [Camelina sativa]
MKPSPPWPVSISPSLGQESMDVTELEENLFAASDAKLHGDMCKELSGVLCKVLSIFPSLEGARPRSKSGIQALCSLHIALEKAKNILQHCSECSKLYLAITGDAVLLKFEKAKIALIDGLKRVEDIVPSSIGSQILEIVGELENTRFMLDPSEKEVGDQIIALLQQGKKFDNCNDNTELETFHRAATRLSITSSRVALAERRALKKLVDRARAEEDKRKESIVAYLLHLMRKCSKLFRSEISDENDSQSSNPCSPTEDHGSVHGFGRQLSRFGSMNDNPMNGVKSGQMPVPPEELRCPISLQLMCDPVIIASGQTYERVCIEKWFSDGHNTCPKTQQQLPHLSLTPNNCVKGLIASWCEQNGTQIPSGPPESQELDYWRLALSDSESTKSKSVNSIGSCKLTGIKVVPLEENGTTVVERQNTEESFVSDDDDEDSDVNVLERYQDLLAVLNEEKDLDKKGKVVEKIRLLLKDDEEARIFMGANGFVEALLRFLESAVDEKNVAAQDKGAMALFNLAVNNNRNKELMLTSGVIPLLEKMISSSESQGSATALYLNLSCLDEAKSVIGASQAVPFLVQLLQGTTENQCKLDALHALYNLSTYSPNISALLSSNIIKSLQGLLASTGENLWIEKSLAVLLNLASSQEGKDEAVSSQGMISSLATVLDMGDTAEQEQAVSCLLILCKGRESCIQMVLQEGVIPSLVSISVNGSTRGREKSQKLLMLFREQRQQRDQPSPNRDESAQKEPPRKSLSAPMSLHGSTTSASPSVEGYEPRVLSKSMSRRKSLARPFSFFWKKSYSIRQ